VIYAVENHSEVPCVRRENHFAKHEALVQRDTCGVQAKYSFLRSPIARLGQTGSPGAHDHRFARLLNFELGNPSCLGIVVSPNS
jgi:hypothetical protein